VHTTKRLARLCLAVVLALMPAISVTVAASPAEAAACYGASCNGLNPEGRCSHDAKTVGAMDVGDGMLELRWSPSCVANWGRFTTYWRTESFMSATGRGIWARVTVWNPGGPSQGTAYHAQWLPQSTYSRMTNGRLQACAGVEILHYDRTSSGAVDTPESTGWWWGPCY
jgi:hypothetical protein